MPKTKDAFAFRDFDVDKILQRKFFNMDGFIDAEKFAERNVQFQVFVKTCSSFNDDIVPVEKYDDAHRRLNLLLRKLGDYDDRIRNHAKKLEKFAVALADKIAISDEHLESRRRQYRRAKFLIEKYGEVRGAISEIYMRAHIQINMLGERVKKLYRKRFAERLKQARLKLELPQWSLADEIDLTTAAYQFYEKGKREPSITTLIRLSRSLGVTPNWLLGFE